MTNKVRDPPPKNLSHFFLGEKKYNCFKTPLPFRQMSPNLKVFFKPSLMFPYLLNVSTASGIAMLITETLSDVTDYY